MGISLSLVFIAAGAILKWAVTATTSGVDLAAVGVVLMVVGAVGLLLSLIFWSSSGRIRRASRDDHHGRPRRRAASLSERCGRFRPLHAHRPQQRRREQS